MLQELENRKGNKARRREDSGYWDLKFQYCWIGNISRFGLIHNLASFRQI